MHQREHQREHWHTQIGVILAVMGSAIGLGNFIRFPGQVALYGGGAFMVPYFISLLVLGLPLAWAEWALGRYGGTHGHNSVPGIFRSIVKRRWIGYAGSFCVLVPVVIFCYYILIETWCLVYTIRYAFGMMRLGEPSAYASYFGKLIGISENGLVFQTVFSNPYLVCLLVCFLLNFMLIYRGITRGIEWFCELALPALFLCSIIILIRVATLGNPSDIEGQSYLDGLGFVWYPAEQGKTTLETLSDPEVWLAAAGQIFFSLSIGFGLVITYASYTRKRADIALSAASAVFGNSFCEVVFGGMMIVQAAVMFLGRGAINKEQLGSSFALGFQTLPSVFEQMPMGQVFGFLFFFLLFLAAVTSSISLLQPAVALLEDGLDLSRRKSVTFLGLFLLTISLLITYFSRNLTALDTLDFWMANVFVFVLATFQVILFGWVLGLEKGMKELEQGAMMRIPRFVKYLIKYVTPVYLLVIFALWAYRQTVFKFHGKNCEQMWGFLRRENRT